MCGIAGFIAHNGSLLPNTTIIRMTDLIYHRGPDDEGFLFISPSREISTGGGVCTPPEVWNDKARSFPVALPETYRGGQSLLAFGHRRLSILDLSASGHQPMSFENDRYWITYNGEIYNFREIRESLRSAGYSFSTRTDTEVILAAYSAWKESCLDRFVGMWAFAIYDKLNDELFIARDRYGIKPLYYYFSPAGDFYFASEIKQFTALDCWQSVMNPQRVYDQLVYSFTDHTDETMFAGVFQLPAGTYFKGSLDHIVPGHSGKLNYTKWYELKRDPFKGSFTEAAGSFRLLFERAVGEHLFADVPVGTALSGGLDSSSIVCEVNRLLRGSGDTDLQRTFSSCSTMEKFSEKRWMDIVINHTEVDAYFDFPRIQDMMAETPEIIWHQDEPYQSQSAFLAYNLFRLAKEKGVKVLLNGQGADEYVGGYGQFTIPRYANMVRNLRFAALIADFRKMRKVNPVSFFSLMTSIGFHFLPPSLKLKISKVRSSSDHIKRIIDSSKLGANPIHPYDIIPASYNTVPEISEHLTFYSTLPKYLNWEDRNSMAHSVEARVPFLDHRLVEFTFNLPDDFLEKDGIRKRIMREAMKGLLPEKIRNRKDKMGFITPEEYWVRKENPALFRSRIQEVIEMTDGIIKPEAIDYFNDVVSGKIPFDYTYWRIILFGEWIKKFRVRA